MSFVTFDLERALFYHKYQSQDLVNGYYLFGRSSVIILYTIHSLENIMSGPNLAETKHLKDDVIVETVEIK